MLNEDQEKALELMDGDDNVFLTGVAGTGKSFLTNTFLEDRDPELFPICAATGAAAILVGGKTFNSFFGLGAISENARIDIIIKKAVKSKNTRARMRKISGVVIDEISMISAQALEAAEAVARKSRADPRPWGGLKVIVVGDFRQLPPVSRKTPKPWAFTSEAWEDSHFKPACLKTPVRTDNQEFFRALNYIRAGVVNEEVKQMLNSRVHTENKFEECTRLFPFRKAVDEFNSMRLEEIDSPPAYYDTSYVYEDPRDLEWLQKNAPIPPTLALKEGAFVMIRKNLPELDVVNGTLGWVAKMGSNYLVIELLEDERRIHLEKQEFHKVDAAGEPEATAVNFPVTLAWACTIHKSQGATLDRVMVDLGSIWEPGQAYVALSRVKSLEGLYIKRWSPAAIKSDDLVTEFHRNLGLTTSSQR